MIQFSIKKLARLAGVSVRTLHLYDEIGLLKPSCRTEARYRIYGENELLRLQQILFYRELDFPLQEIKWLLDDSGFDMLRALTNHRAALRARRDRIDTLLGTIDQTMFNLKQANGMENYETLYEGFPKEQAEAYRTEIAATYGADVLETAEKSLLKMSKEEQNELKNRFLEIGQQLANAADQDPTSAPVQALIACHYQCIAQFWGTLPKADAYVGLGELYVSDERYLSKNGEPNPTFAAFMRTAMRHFATVQLQPS